jgi:glutamate dehydrogenase/leucine dehydrogenase
MLKEPSLKEMPVHDAPVKEVVNPFAMAQHQLDKAAAVLQLEPVMHAFLRVPMREFHFIIPVCMDDGHHEIFQGYRVQYNDARGPAKGGIRFHPDETIDTIRALAAWMTWKTAVVDIPLGELKVASSVTPACFLRPSWSGLAGGICAASPATLA